MPLHEEFGAKILCDEKELEEHQMKVDLDASVISCWIISATNQEFEVNIQWKRSGHHRLLCILKCDGQVCHKEVLRKNMSGTTLNGSYLHEDGKPGLRPFTFRKRGLIDDPDYIADPNCGTISVSFWRIKVIGSDPSGEYDAPGHDNISTDVGEEKKLLIPHCIQLGEMRPTPDREVNLYKTLDQEPLTEFKFHYRSKAILQAHGIIPRKEDNGKASDSDEEPSLVARLLFLQQQKERIRRRKNLKAKESPIDLTLDEGST